MVPVAAGNTSPAVVARSPVAEVAGRSSLAEGDLAGSRIELGCYFDRSSLDLEEDCRVRHRGGFEQGTEEVRRICLTFYSTVRFKD